MARRIQQCYDGPQVYLLDVSHHQGRIDWEKVAAHRWIDSQGHEAHITGAFIRALEGTTPDETFVRNWQGAKAAGLVVGPYVYFRARHGGGVQVAALREMLQLVGGLGPADMPPLLDMETLDGQTKAEFLTRVHDWVRACKSVLGRTAWMYSGAFWNGYVGASDFKAHPLMTPDYRSSRCAGVPYGWDEWTMHQFTSRAQVSGVPGNVDMSRFRGPEQTFKAFIARSRPGASWWKWLFGLAAVTGVGYGLYRWAR